jgi:tetratricopeptide (TPR) repeat protein
MGKAYLKKLPQVYEFMKEDLHEDIEKVQKNGLPKIAGSFYSSRSMSLKVIAICDYLVNRDVNAMKNRLHNAALAGLKSLTWYDSKIGDINISNSLSMIKSDILEYAIISEDLPLIKDIAKMLGGRGDLDSAEIDEIAYHVGYALKYVTLDRCDAAINHLKELLKLNPIDYIIDYANVLVGIAEGDSDKVNTSISSMLKEYSKLKSKANFAEEFICLSAIALAKLAESKNLVINIDDGLAPKEIIASTEIEYEVIDFLKC